MKALCHITGGGLLENMPRVMPEAFAAEIDAASWTPPPVFGWLAAGSKSGTTEMLRTFNCGIGMVLVVAAADADAVIAILKENGEPSVATLGRMKPRAAGAEQVDIKGAAVWGWPEPPAAK